MFLVVNEISQRIFIISISLYIYIYIYIYSILFKVASRVQKIEVFQIGWKSGSCCCFANCILKNHYFFHGGKNGVFFPYFYYEIIFCSAEIFECAFSFTFCKKIFIFLNCRQVFWKHMSESKLTGQQLYFTDILKILVTSFWPVLKNLLKL